jgi:stearoyl-CoA desaturase (delta-9 desaturase)
MSFQGAVTDWVALHRRHHAFADRPGDPHSSYRCGTGPISQLRGLVYAHAAWLFGEHPSAAWHYASDMAADPAMRRVSRAFPLLCVASLAMPDLAGFAISDGRLHAAWTVLLWAGLIRVAYSSTSPTVSTLCVI